MRIPGSFARKVTGSAKAIEFNPPGNNNAHSRFNPNPPFIFCDPQQEGFFFSFKTSIQYAMSNHSHHLTQAPESSWWVSAGCLAAKTDFSVNDILCFNCGARTKVIYTYIYREKAACLSFVERGCFYRHVVHSWSLNSVWLTSFVALCLNV